MDDSEFYIKMWTNLHNCFVDAGVLTAGQDCHAGVLVRRLLQLANDLRDLLVRSGKKSENH